MSGCRDGMSLTFRPAHPADLAALAVPDALAATGERRAWLVGALERQAVSVGVAGDQLCAYSVMEEIFLGHAFVSLLCVAPAWRRRGVGAALLVHLCAVASTLKVFSSTDVSNAPMHALFRRLGWEVSGVLNLSLIHI